MLVQKVVQAYWEEIKQLDACQEKALLKIGMPPQEEDHCVKCGAMYRGRLGWVDNRLGVTAEVIPPPNLSKDLSGVKNLPLAQLDARRTSPTTRLVKQPDIPT